MQLDTNTLFLGDVEDTLIKLALNDIHNGLPVVFIGPDELLDYIPKERQSDVVYFKPDIEHPFSFNVLYNCPFEKRAQLISLLLLALKGYFGYDDTPTPNIEQYVRAVLGTLLEQKKTTLVDALFTLIDDDFRKDLVNKVNYPPYRYFWDRFAQKDKKIVSQEIESTVNKLWSLTFDPIVLYSLIQKKNHVTFKDKIVIVSLPQAELGKENVKLLGSLILAQLAVSGVETNLYVHNAQDLGTSLLSHIITTQKDITVGFSLPYLDAVPKMHQRPLLAAVDQIFTTRCSIEDDKLLKPYFNIGESDTQLYGLGFTGDGYPKARLGFGIGHQKLEARPHDYPLTLKVKKKIIRRCKSQFTTPRQVAEDKVEKKFSGSK